MTESETEEVKPVTESPQNIEVSTKKAKLSNKDNKKMRKLHAQFIEQNANRKEKLKTKLRVLRSTLGKRDYRALKEICTTNVPEMKDAVGEIIQKAAKQINYTALLAEGKLAISLNREQRIKTANRKRSSGRSSKRASHSATVSYIEKRNNRLAKKD